MIMGKVGEVTSQETRIKDPWAWTTGWGLTVGWGIGGAGESDRGILGELQ